jgi:hypothetical protein
MSALVNHHGGDGLQWSSKGFYGVLMLCQQSNRVDGAFSSTVSKDCSCLRAQGMDSYTNV